MVVTQVIFIILSAVALIGALGVVLSRNLFHAAIFLVLSFVGVAGFYVLLEAEFLAMIQILVYVGAISILIIFAIMLSRRLMSPDFRASNEQWLWALVAAVALFAILVIVLIQVDWPVAQAEVPSGTLVELGKALVDPGQYLLVFEVASVLLLVALVGAVIVARER
ncbi:MAG: NADH-quinone oxidoreductase subunit J [Anaerolineae bacterium]|jgi:NADH-quinone oxidoreductase subunit J